MHKLGMAIRQRLRQLGKTQVWLAGELEVSNNAVTKWIRTGKISRENSLAAAKALGMTVEDLLGVDQHGGGVPIDDSSDEMLRRAAEMIETYRLASATDRERIDLVIREIRAGLTSLDEAKTRSL